MKRLVSVSMLLTAAVVLLAGCNCFNKMAKKSDSIQVTATPSVLVLKGSQITTDVRVTFPPKYFDEISVLKVTPVLVFEGGELEGTPKFVQGMKVVDNYTIIPWKDGGSYTQTVAFPYDSRASVSTLELRIESRCINCSDKYRQFQPFKTVTVAKGVSMPQGYADYASAMSLMKDNLVRVNSISQEATIQYDVNSSRVKPAELSKNQIKLFEDFVKEYTKTNADTKLESIYSKGYASPEGPVAYNDKLSKDRSQTGQKAINSKLKDNSIKYDVAAYGEDWDGFKALVEQSNMKDKDLIIKVLEMYSSSVRRDQEIRNMSNIFAELKTDILPKLRRTQLVASVGVPGMTDAELIEAVKTNKMSTLKAEELLYAATLVPENKYKIAAYQYAAEKHNIAAAYNNLAIVYVKEGELAKADAALEKAASLQSAPEITNNTAVVKLAQGKLEEAKKYSSSVTPATKALIALNDGNYTEAVKGMSGYNLAVAELSNSNLSKAKSALSGISTADADYLRAVIAAREGETSNVVTNLKSAISKDPKKAAAAKNDMEFTKYFGLPEFKAL